MFGLVFQLGRTAWGTANMGGNGQFNRLSALDAVATAEGPWRHRLTEDQDIGLRLIAAGWRGHHEVGSYVSQQGLTALRPLYRQRTRWAQGSWQAMSLFSTVRRARVSALARLDMTGYLLLPALQMYTALALVTAVVIALTTDIGFWSAAWPIIVFFLVTTAGPGLFALLARGRGFRGLVVALACLVPYTVYSWLTFPAIARGLVRQLTGRGFLGQDRARTPGARARAAPTKPPEWRRDGDRRDLDVPEAETAAAPPDTPPRSNYPRSVPAHDWGRRQAVRVERSRPRVEWRCWATQRRPWRRVWRVGGDLVGRVRPQSRRSRGLPGPSGPS